MYHSKNWLAAALLWLACSAALATAGAQTHESTRVTDPQQHARVGTASYPYREKADYIFSELDLRPGDVVVDIGAGDGWWSERMAKRVGESGVIHAAEVNEKKVEQMKKKFADTPQVKPYLCKPDDLGLDENSCDLAFFSQSYHHLNRNSEADYLRHLRRIVKPTGRVCVIEKEATISSRGKAHGTPISRLVKQTEEAGWVLARYELMPGTYHYLAIFVQKDLFPPEREAERSEPASNDTSGAKRQETAHTKDSLEKVKAMLADDKAVLVDVREQAEWNAGHLAGAVLLPLSELNKKAGSDEFTEQLSKRLPKGKAVYCHCRSGGRALKAGEILKELGYDVRPLKAGYTDLLEACFPKAE
jgi:phage shock protein E